MAAITENNIPGLSAFRRWQDIIAYSASELPDPKALPDEHRTLKYQVYIFRIKSTSNCVFGWPTDAVQIIPSKTAVPTVEMQISGDPGQAVGKSQPQFLACRLRDGTINIWNITNWETGNIYLIKHLAIPGVTPQSLLWNPHARHRSVLAVTCADNRVCIWDTFEINSQFPPQDHPKANMILESAGCIESIEWSPCLAYPDVLLVHRSQGSNANSNIKLYKYPDSNVLETVADAGTLSYQWVNDDLAARPDGTYPCMVLVRAMKSNPEMKQRTPLIKYVSLFRLNVRP